MRSPCTNVLSRRQILRLGTAAALAARVGLPRRASATPKVPVGLQLFSVRADCARDLPATLAAVAALGYVGVEFTGYYDRDGAELRRLLEGNALKCCGTHISLKSLTGEDLERTIEFNAALGNRFLVVPSLPPERRSTRRDWLETARMFDEIAAQLQPAGMRVGYHNHGFEFRPLDGEVPWDTFFSNTRQDVFMQMDVGNAMDGGADPVSYLKKYPKRAVTVHVRESCRTNRAAYLGEGDVDWRQVFETLEAGGVTEWYIVEHDAPRVPAVLEHAARCLENLRKMGKCPAK